MNKLKEFFYKSFLNMFIIYFPTLEIRGKENNSSLLEMSNHKADNCYLYFVCKI